MQRNLVTVIQSLAARFLKDSVSDRRSLKTMLRPMTCAMRLPS
jgi:hypothetical protein